MNPTYQYSAAYAAYTTAGSWTFEAGALGRESGWHLGVRRQRDPLSGGLRVERLSSDELCGQADSRIVYVVPDARLRVPVSQRLAVTGAASYRGKLSTARCAFRPSLLTLSLAAELDARPDLSFQAGLGHHGLVDYGAGAPTGPWPERARAAEFFTLGARHTRGRITMFADLRTVFYAGATTALLFGLEVRSSPSAP
jgi:hypothetical protein